MTLSIWRYSHLALAVSSFVFILMASVTGIILAFEPISNQLKPYDVSNIEAISVAKTITTLGANYDEIISLTVDNDAFVSVSVVNKKGVGEAFYINPMTGEKIGKLIAKAPIFKFATNLHRSLFLKKTGRFFVGLASLLLCLIVISGGILIIKRQGNIRQFFSKIVNENRWQYGHIVLGRLSLIPILIISITGVYLSLEKFNLLPDNGSNHAINFETLRDTPRRNLADFPIFKNTPLSAVRHIEFPFSTDAEDYFTLALKDREIVVNQMTGEVLSELQYPLSKMLSYYSLILHTGQGCLWWSIVLIISMFCVLFFIYSGFKMTRSRRRKNQKWRNTFNKDEAQYIVLVGSETGGTRGFAIAFCKALFAQGQSVFISELNNYTTYAKATHVIIFTATYGDGDAPNNARKFIRIFKKINPNNALQYSVVGFGSLAYSGYCKYAVLVDQTLQEHSKFTRKTPLCKINNQSYESFKNWSEQWCGRVGLDLRITPPPQKVASKNIIRFTVIEKTELNVDQTFLLRLRPHKKITFASGDWLSITPEKDSVERLYSIGRLGDDLLLSIKKHAFGVVSPYLSALSDGAIVRAEIKRNPSFYFPKKAKPTILISNGTGIAPFLGMIEAASSQQTIHLFWGGRTQASLELYSPYLAQKSLQSFCVAYSQEAGKQYVQHVVEEQKSLLISVIRVGGTILICGSVAMQHQLLDIIESICEETLNCSISHLEKTKQLKMDCY